MITSLDLLSYLTAFSYLIISKLFYNFSDDFQIYNTEIHYIIII